METDLTARINAHKNESMYQQLGEKVERLKEQLELGQITSAEYLRGMREIAREMDKIESLTKLFSGMNVTSGQIIRDIDYSVRAAMFENWQKTVEGVRSVKAALRHVMWLKYGIRDEKIFSGVYKYIEQYY